jgi:hypothetical protein
MVAGTVHGLPRRCDEANHQRRLVTAGCHPG